MDEQWMVVKMMYGAQVDAGDFHHVRCGVYVRVYERVVAVVIGC